MGVKNSHKVILVSSVPGYENLQRDFSQSFILARINNIDNTKNPAVVGFTAYNMMEPYAYSISNI